MITTLNCCQHRGRDTTVIKKKRDMSSLLFWLIFLILPSVVLINGCVYYRTALEDEYRKQGDLSYEEQKYTEALEYYKKSKFITYNNNSRFRVAEILLRLKKYEEARKEINRLLSRDSRNVLVKELDAYWYFATGDVDAAVIRYEKILQNEPYNTRVLNNLGIINFRKTNYQVAIDYFNTSLDIEVLPTELLDNYIVAVTNLQDEAYSNNQYSPNEINTTNQEGSSVSQDLENTYLIETVKRYTSGFQEDKVDITNLDDLATLLSKRHHELAFSLYVIIAELDINDVRLKPYVAHANFMIAKFIFSEIYVPKDIDSLQFAFESLAISLSYGYGGIKEEWQEVQDLSSHLKTKVQKKKMADLLLEHSIISQAEYAHTIENLDNADEDSTDKNTLPTRGKNDSEISDLLNKIRNKYELPILIDEDRTVVEDVPIDENQNIASTDKAVVSESISEENWSDPVDEYNVVEMTIS